LSASVSTSRVGRVRLRLGVPAELADQTAELRSTVERTFVVRVLDELEQLLHARFGAHAVIRIRRLAVACQLDAVELAAHDAAAKLARDLGEKLSLDIGALSDADRLRPFDERIAIFAGETHADAAYLADIADGRADRWLHAARTGAGDAWTGVLARGSAALGELVQWLRRMERLEAVLALAGDHVHEALIAEVPEVAGVVELVRARTAARRGHPPAGRGVRGDAPAAQHAEASETVPAPAGATNATDDASAVTTHGALSLVDATPDAAGARAHAVAAIATLAKRDVPSTPPPAELVATASDRGIVLDTDAAGLFYLVGRVLEIELAERLWAAGVPEGIVLAAIGNAVLGRTDDPAARWFGGGFEKLAPPAPVEAWAMTEVNDGVQHALGRRLVDFGVRMSAAELDAALEQLARDVPAPVGIDGITRRLVARSVAALATIVCARLGERPSLVRLREVCVRPGRLVLTDEELHVVLPHYAIDVSVRRAGLDQDPGDAPWLGRRRVRIELVAAEIM
jgi:hypothetical protein